MSRENTAFIINAQRNGLGIARSLGEIGVECVFVDNDPINVGFVSRYCKDKITKYKNDEELIGKLITKAKQEAAKPVLFAASDDAVLFMNCFQGTLKEHFLFTVPDFDLTYQLVNKELTCSLANEHGISTPKTFFTSHTSVETIQKAITYPCIIKPHFSHLVEKKVGKRVFFARTRQELQDIIGILGDFKDTLLIQEVIEGGDENIWFLGGYFNETSLPLMYFTGKKLRQCPIEFGSTSLAECVVNRDIERRSIDFLKKIKFKGLCDIEFKQGKDGEYYLMEVNPRAGLWHRLGNLAGRDIIRACYRDLTKEAPPALSPMESGKWMAEDRDIISALKYAKKKRITFKRWARTLRGKKIFSLWDKKDMKPFFYYFFFKMPQYVFKKRFRKKKPYTKRIAYIISQFPEMHETFILREIVELHKKGIEIDIFSLKQCSDEIIHPDAKEFMKKTHYPRFGLRFFWYNLYFLITSPVRYCALLFSLIRDNRSMPQYMWKSLYAFPISVYYAGIIKKKKIEHIHAHWLTIPATSAFVIARLLKKEFSVTAHAWDIFMQHPTQKVKIQQAKFILTCTRFNKRRLEQMTGRNLDGKVIVNYHGLCLDEFKMEGTRNNNEMFTIIAVGSLQNRKGYEHLIKACKILKERKMPFVFQIAGEGRLRPELTALVSELGLENEIALIGARSQSEIKELLQEADIFALGCQVTRRGNMDGIPNVILEACAMNLPIVATNISGIPEAVEDGASGILVEQKDAAALADAICKLMEDKELREEYGRRGREIIEEKFDIIKNTQEIVHIFEQKVFM